jgi:anti-sigma factor RsiW
MNNKPCSTIEGLLVDFADGELTDTQCRRVADHLATCSECRAELRLLERSLELVRAVWQQDALPLDKETAPALPALSIVRKVSLASRLRPRGRRAITACLAACALLLLLASAAWWLPRLKSDRKPASAIAGQEASPPRSVNGDEIDSFISRQARAARLAVAVRLLASQPGLEGYKDQAERYLAEVSSETGRGP